MKDKDRLLSDLANTVAPRQVIFFLNKKLCVEAGVFWKELDGLSLDDDGWMMCVFFFLVKLGKSVFHFVSF